MTQKSQNTAFSAQLSLMSQLSGFPQLTAVTLVSCSARKCSSTFASLHPLLGLIIHLSDLRHKC